MPIILDGNGIIKNINFQHPSASATNLSLNSDGTIAGAIPYPNRNLIYNGACQIHQRSASVASITTSGYYTADRWDLEISSLGTWTQSIENDAPTGSGFRKSLKMLCTTADASPSASDYAIIQQKLEGQDLQRVAKGTSSAQQLTLSFWVKSNITGTYIANLTDADNSSGGISRFNSQIYVINNSATWEKKTITFVSDTSGILDNDNAISLYVRFWLGAGSTFTSGTLRSSSWSSTSNNEYAAGQTNLAAATNNYWQITGVQLETGSIATPFEFKSFGQELRECQRYYEKSYDIAVNPGTVTGTHIGSVYYNNNGGTFNTFFAVPVVFNTYKRAAPTVTVYSPGTGTSGRVQINTAGNPDVVGGAVITTSQGFSGGITSGSGGNLMSFNWVASVEL